MNRHNTAYLCDLAQVAACSARCLDFRAKAAGRLATAAIQAEPPPPDAWALAKRAGRLCRLRDRANDLARRRVATLKLLAFQQAR